MRHLTLRILLVLSLALTSLVAHAQSNPAYMTYDSGNALPFPQPITTTTLDLGTSAAIAAKLRAPASGGAHVGIVVMHPYSSYVNWAACTELAKRGYAVLCVDSMFTGKQAAYYGYEQHVPAIRAAVNYLREQKAIKKVLVLGHSMGAPMMAFYQNVAENGPTACTDKKKLIPCVTTNLDRVPPADGVILFDAHLGDSFATLTYVDPAVKNNSLGDRDPALDMFAEANGYDAVTNGAKYSPGFKTAFLAAQAERNAALNEEALRLLAEARKTNPDSMGDEIPFPVVGSLAARLFQPDTDLLQCTQKPQVLLSRDGARPVQVVCSVRPPSGAAKLGLSESGGQMFTVHSWLGAHGMRTTSSYDQTKNDLTGVDYSSTATSTVGNAVGITKPFLIMANSGHYFIRPNEIVFDAVNMADKTYAIVEGATHGGTECSACEKIQGLPQPSESTFGFYGDTFSRTMNFMSEWINKRF